MADSGSSTEASVRVLSRLDLLRYGLMALPLQLAAVPIYIHVAKVYADRFALSLGLIGLTLLITRLGDAVLDPMIGGWIDRGKSRRSYRGYITLAAPLLLLGYLGLFHPPLDAGAPAVGVIAWMTASLTLVYLGFSLASIAHQAWGSELALDPVQRTRITTSREFFGLVGVISAAVLPTRFGMEALSATLIAGLGVGMLALWSGAPEPDRPVTGATTGMPSQPPTPLWAGLRIALGNTRFRWLLGAFVANGIASAIPATLVLFFIADVLELEARAGDFLGTYFLVAALGMPAWVALSARLGPRRAWLLGMLLAILGFLGASQLGAGDATGFLLICVATGFALGADLALPSVLLADVIHRAGHKGQHEGAYFGLWNFLTKLNLALAAGAALPLLEPLGYTPGARGTEAVAALLVTYAVLPCALKLVAAWVLWRAPLETHASGLDTTATPSAQEAARQQP